MSSDVPARPSILIVDDDPISREVLSMVLEMNGWPVVSAEDGAGALAQLATSAAGIVLMDTQMPGLSGVALIEALRRVSSARIVAISGSEVDNRIRQAADGFLLKPIQPDDMEKLLSESAPSALPIAAAGTAHVMPSESRFDLIDPEVLGKLRAMMPAAAVREIYAAVAADLPPRLALLADAMEAGDAAEVAHIAHSIKGGCSMVGVTLAAEAAARLESSNRNGTWLEELSYLTAAHAALERILLDDFPR